MSLGQSRPGNANCRGPGLLPTNPTLNQEEWEAVAQTGEGIVPPPVHAIASHPSHT